MANGYFKPLGKSGARAFDDPHRRWLVAGWFASMVAVALLAVLITVYFSGREQRGSAPGNQTRQASAQPPIGEGAPGNTIPDSADNTVTGNDAAPGRGKVVESSPDTQIERTPGSGTSAAQDADDAARNSANGSGSQIAGSGDASGNGTGAGSGGDTARLKLALAQGLVALPAALVKSPPSKTVAGWCDELASRVDSVSTGDCMSGSFKDSGSQSVEGRPMIVGDFPATSRPALGRVLLISATHGDEPSSIGTAFRWMKLMASDGTRYEWNIVPTLNPDGALHQPATRVNANGVDLNRNLPTNGWAKESRDYWRRVGFEKRRFPGESAGSEPENRWLAEEIQNFKPNVIVTLHAPYGVLDYDGQFPPPQKLGRLNLHRLGIYPGSLGNYASHMRGIPVITVELDDAREPPSEEEIEAMWTDLNGWLDRYFRNVRQASAAGSRNDAG